MAWSSMLNLNTPVAHRLIRCLYTAALVVVAIVTVLGIARGVMIMTRPAPAPITAAAPGLALPNAPGGPPAAMPAPRPGRPFFRTRRFGPSSRFMGPVLRGQPVLAGAVQIVLALLRGLVVLMVVRILAEMGLAVLVLGERRS
jgi:hypothetical protein